MAQGLLNGTASLSAVSAASGQTTPVAAEDAGAVTSLDETLVRGMPGAAGYAPIETAPGEGYVQRVDLGFVVPGRPPARRVVASFAHMTDIHVVDAQSPARFEFLDPYAGLADLTGAYRPQEFLTAHVGEAMVRRLRSIRRAPATGHPLQFVVVTGDNTGPAGYGASSVPRNWLGPAVVLGVRQP